MKRLPINLAAQPIERVRAARRTVAYVAASALLVTLVHLVLLGWITRGAGVPEAAPVVTVDAATLTEWQAEVDRLAAVADVERARAAGTAVASGNQLIAWRTIPWRSIFADLEQVLPRRARLEVVAPGIDGDGAVRIQMTAAARDAGPLQDLLLELESHPSFDEVWPDREQILPDGSSQMILRALYVRRVEVEDDPEATAAEVSAPQARRASTTAVQGEQ